MRVHPISTHGLSIGYAQRRRPDRVVASGIDLTLAAGELVCLLGPNGAGKTTLLRTLAGMHKPLSGQVRVQGADVRTLSPAELARRLSVVLTDRANPGLLTAYALAALGRHPYTGWTGRLSEADTAAVDWALDAVGATDLAERMVHELSDGERQKVMIARALAQDPALMILDEPTAFLDLPRRAEVMHLLRDLTRTTGRAILLSTHDLALALETADRVWLLPVGGPVQTGAPEDLVLSGAFEQAFLSDGVTFDATTGSFRAATEAAATVALTGEGLALIWTRRALERAGYTVLDPAQINGHPPLATVEAFDSDWRVTLGQRTRRVDTLYDVIALLAKAEPIT
jgi:iron complex transport system ATP-binding protein